MAIKHLMPLLLFRNFKLVLNIFITCDNLTAEYRRRKRGKDRTRRKPTGKKKKNQQDATFKEGKDLWINSKMKNYLFIGNQIRLD